MSNFIDIRGVGPKKESYLLNLGIDNQKELVYHLPLRYEDFRKEIKLNQGSLDENKLYRLKILSKNPPKYLGKNKTINKIYASDGQNKCQIIYFNDRFTPKTLKLGCTYRIYGKLNKEYNNLIFINPKIIKESEQGIFGVYPTTKGISQKDLRSFISQALYKFSIDDFVPKSILKKRKLLGLADALNFIHLPSSYKEIYLAKERIEYTEYFIRILGLKYLRNKSSYMKRQAYSSYTKVNELLKQLNFHLTKDQVSVLEEILHDMSSAKAMNRLIQGDVGSGKTIVAVASGVHAVGNNEQVAFIAPTEVLARQHFEKSQDIFEKIGIKSQLLTGSTKAKHKVRIKEELSKNKIDFIFGTHALLEDDVEFKKLGLVIVDEQQRFGVRQRYKLGKKGFNPHYLSLSATPIPRTLALSYYGDMDISTIKTKPKGRGRVSTYAVGIGYEERIFSYMENIISKGGQVFIISPLVEDNDDNLASITLLQEKVEEYLPERTYRILYGDMLGEDKNKVVKDFENKIADILISTTVIEVGIDIANANLMVIYNAERFGLSQLHQLRGRVGRGSSDAECILICTSNSKSARKRMDIMSSTSDGFKIAEEDLKNRGPGEVLGLNQHGKEEFFKSYNNLSLLEKSFEDADYILSKDPSLEKYPVLREYLESLYSGHKMIILN